MPFTWQININKSPGKTPGYAYDPNPLSQVTTGDQIIWSNNDDKPHWPGITGNKYYFMANQIAPNSPSTAFVPGVPGALTYTDSLDPSGPAGTIVVGSPGDSAATIAVLLVALASLFPAATHAQNQQLVACPAKQQSVLAAPEIRSANGKLKATLKLLDGVRTLWGFTGDNRCATQNLRYLMGFDPANPAPWPAGPEPIPGPTFRARVGDLVEISFFNQINLNNFASTLDRGAVGSTAACDQFTTSSQSGSRTGVPGGDTMPNCLHGSSTSNIHFHGTHTTPSTTGDNILLLVRPSLRTNGQVQPAEAEVNAAFAQVFQQCEQNGPPKRWMDMPNAWETLQQRLLQQYDSTAPYQGNPGTLPDTMRLWPANQSHIENGLWPQYQIGATPYCFPLPRYNPPAMNMGQAPGTHWYHAHKHGSTALNVANGLTGTFIIEGQYDDDLRRYYGPTLREQVLMVQQLSSAPFQLTNPQAPGPGATAPARPPLSINGRLNPVVGMRPGEVQLWRVVNGAFRDAVQFAYFEPQAATACAARNPARSPVQWRQIAQDGVQFNVANYRTFGAVGSSFNLAPANRADLLVKAPTQTGSYTLCVIRNSALFIQTDTNTYTLNGVTLRQSAAPAAPDAPSALLTVTVAGAPVSPAMSFIPDAQFPTFPVFLADIPPGDIRNRRELVFGAGNSTINGVSFQDEHVDQLVLLNNVEEWTVKNEANDKSHPFHIHVNPFQIFEVFEPNSPEASDKSNPCYVDPSNPATFKPCPSRQPPAPWVWWDTFAIPSGRTVSLSCTTLDACPAPIQPYTRCTGGRCTQYIPGYFKMRTRFVDFTGQYVLHCHILIHEDRGMMQLIEVVSDKTPYTHH